MNDVKDVTFDQLPVDVYFRYYSDLESAKKYADGRQVYRITTLGVWAVESKVQRGEA